MVTNYVDPTMLSSNLKYVEFRFFLGCLENTWNMDLNILRINITSLYDFY